ESFAPAADYPGPACRDRTGRRRGMAYGSFRGRALTSAGTAARFRVSRSRETRRKKHPKLFRANPLLATTLARPFVRHEPVVWGEGVQLCLFAHPRRRV